MQGDVEVHIQKNASEGFLKRDFQSISKVPLLKKPPANARDFPWRRSAAV